jgi:hypothetical protein
MTFAVKYGKQLERMENFLSIIQLTEQIKNITITKGGLKLR